MVKFSDFHLGILTALFSMLLLYSSWGFPSIPGQAYGAGTLPRLLGWSGLALAAILVAQSITRPDQWRVHFADWVRSPKSIAAVLAVIGVVLFYILFSNDIGFLPSAVIVMLVPMLVLRVNPILAIFVSIVMAFFVRYAFGNLLLVPLPASSYLSFVG